MSKLYNQIAAASLERLAALSDGIFAVAMTLLVLNLHIPAAVTISQIVGQPLWSPGTLPLEAIFWNKLTTLAPSITTYLLSFLTLGIFWVGQQTQLNHFKRANRNLAWLHLGFLFAVSLMPFSTELLAAFITFRIALVIYWLNILLLGTMLFVGWQYGERSNFIKEEISPEMRSAVMRRIIIAQALYAFGALLCIFNTYVSITFIVLVQLNYAIAPRIRWLYRL